MQQDISQFLAKIGLTDKETTLYLASLKHGPQTASILEKKTGLARSTVNFVFAELIRKGFASKTQKKNSTYYSVIKPKSIGYIIDEKKAEIKKLGSDFASILPLLASMQSNLSSVPKVRYFEGVEGLCRTVDNCCEKDETVYFISSHNNMHPKVRQHIENVYIPKSKKHDNKNKMILNDGPETEEYIEKAEGVYDEVIKVKPEEIPFKLTTAVHGNTTLLISYAPEDMSGIIIENQLIADHMKSIYKALAKSFTNQAAPK